MQRAFDRTYGVKENGYYLVLASRVGKGVAEPFVPVRVHRDQAGKASAIHAASEAPHWVSYPLPTNRPHHLHQSLEMSL